MGECMKIIVKNQEVLIDDDDFELVSQYNWWISNRGYVSSKNKEQDKRITIRMHRLILGCKYKDGLIVDHIDGNILNNQKSNLRFCTCTENARNSKTHSNNSTGYKGVSKAYKDKFRANIQFNGKYIYLGYFDTPEEAHAAYCKAAELYHKEFANFGTKNKGDKK